MKAKIDVERFVASLIKYANETSSSIRLDELIDSLEDQGLTYVEGEITEKCFNEEEWTREDYLADLYFEYNHLEKMIAKYGDRTASNILQNIQQKIKYWEERK